MTQSDKQVVDLWQKEKDKVRSEAKKQISIYKQKFSKAFRALEKLRGEHKLLKQHFDVNEELIDNQKT